MTFRGCTPSPPRQPCSGFDFFLSQTICKNEVMYLFPKNVSRHPSAATFLNIFKVGTLYAWGIVMFSKSGVVASLLFFLSLTVFTILRGPH